MSITHQCTGNVSDASVEAQHYIHSIMCTRHCQLNSNSPDIYYQLKFSFTSISEKLGPHAYSNHMQNMKLFVISQDHTNIGYCLSSFIADVGSELTESVYRYRCLATIEFHTQKQVNP